MLVEKKCMARPTGSLGPTAMHVIYIQIKVLHLSTASQTGTLKL